MGKVLNAVVEQVPRAQSPLAGELNNQVSDKDVEPKDL
jgi:hypothetical protein